MVSKQTINAEKILKRIHIHNKNDGGAFILNTGSQGSAKTAVMGSFADYTALHHPEDKIFWSETYRAPLQSYKLDTPIQFFCKEGIDFHFRDRDNKLKEFRPDIIYFNSYKELYEKAKSGIINVPFFGNRMYWMDFIDYLRDVGEWVHVFIDEIGEICPAFEKGLLWDRIGYFGKNTAKDIRKAMINVNANTQALSGIDWRVLIQVLIRIYLPGAIRGKHSRVTQKAIDNLKEDPVNGNQAYLEMKGKFGVTRFTDIYKPKEKKHHDVVCDGGEGVPYIIPLHILNHLKEIKKQELEMKNSIKKESKDVDLQTCNTYE